MTFMNSVSASACLVLKSYPIIVSGKGRQSGLSIFPGSNTFTIPLLPFTF
jgi:hypothetical protein